MMMMMMQQTQQTVTVTRFQIIEIKGEVRESEWQFKKFCSKFLKKGDGDTDTV